MEPAPFQVVRPTPGAGSVELEGESAGEGPPIVLLHGLTATRRNVVQGSRHLVRRGYRLIAYDARGHGDSSPAPRYEYADLVDDLAAVLDHLEIERTALVGSSMGAVTAMAFALDQPERTAALVQITPAYVGHARSEDGNWEQLASALEDRGVEGFVEAAQPDDMPERWSEVTRAATRQRMERHRRPEAVVRALREVPRSVAWEGLERLADLRVPVLIVGSRDDSDSLHPLAVAQEYERRLPDAELAVEEPGSSPLAWQGSRLSGVIGDFLERVNYRPAES